MWKIAHPQPSRMARTDQPMAAEASIHSSRKMISPAYMFPKSRSECDRGLEMYSTRLKRKLRIHSSGFEPNGEQKSSWIQPPSPLVFSAKAIMRNHTDSASAKVVFTSAVGTP